MRVPQEMGSGASDALGVTDTGFPGTGWGVVRVDLGHCHQGVARVNIEMRTLLHVVPNYPSENSDRYC